MRRLSNRFFQIIVQLTLVISASLFLVADRPVFAKPLKKNRVPPVKMVTLAGDTVSLKEFCKDKPTFIYFWATWCKVCSKNMKKVFNLQNEFGDKIHLFGIAWKDSAQAIREYFNKKEDRIVSYIDTDGTLFKAFNIKSTPTVMIVSSGGEIIYQGFGSFRKFKRVLKKQLSRK